MTGNTIFIPYSVNTGKVNMDIDESLLNRAVSENQKKPVLRLYGWSPECVSLGRNQDDSHINKDYCLKNNIDIVRRLTGGRALLHDNELTYSFVCPVSFLKNGQTIIQSYKEISGALAAGLKKAGIDAYMPLEKKASTNFEYCMSLSTGADLSFKGKKIAGSAQFRKHGYILQHGSIMFDYNKEKIKNIFGEAPLEEKITTIKESAPQLSLEGLCDSLKFGFEEYFNLDFKPST